MKFMAYRGEITVADTMSSGRRAGQGLHQIVRDCVNQLLRHLLRTIKPSLTVEAFKILDVRTRDVNCRLFDINESDFNRLAGMGLITYGVADSTIVG
jgi:hypothetical protein